MCNVLCPRFWQYCSDCTRWTPYSLGLTALDMYRHSGVRLDLLHAGPKQEQKLLCSCLFWMQAGIAAVCSLDQRSFWELERFQPIHHVALGFLVLLLGRRCNLLVKATGFPVPIRELGAKGCLSPPELSWFFRSLSVHQNFCQC